MEKRIVFRAIIEVLGKPVEHVEKTIKEYVEKLKKDQDYKVVSEEFAEMKKQEKEEMWATFAELEVETNDLTKIFNFCFEYMPSLIEIVEPKELKFKDQEVSMTLNDLQSKLHGVDMVAKHVRAENDMLKSSMTALLRNYLTVLLGKQPLTSEQLAQLTGVKKDKLEDYLDQLIDEGKVDLKEGTYYLKK